MIKTIIINPAIGGFVLSYDLYEMDNNPFGFQLTTAHHEHVTEVVPDESILIVRIGEILEMQRRITTLTTTKPEQLNG